MTQLKCIIGSIGFVGKKPPVARGDTFTASDHLAKSLINYGYAKQVEPEQVKPEKAKKAKSSLKVKELEKTRTQEYSPEHVGP